MSIILLDQYGRPPIGARVYVHASHALGVITGFDGNSRCIVKLDEDEHGRRHRIPADRLKVIGPPELLENCVIDTCPICEEYIRIRKHER